jgi:uncharacterized protein (TIGR03382 family)
MSSDPSGGECDGAGWVDPEHGGKDGCQNKVRGSLESWITQLEVRYDDCVKAAVFNSNSALAYTEHSEPFDDNGKIEFEDWSCSQIAAGCFFDAELRPFCEIDDFTEQSTCAQAGNPVDANASGDGGGVDESGDGGDGGVAPFGDIGALADCAAAPPYELYCNIDEDLRYNVAYNFHIVYEEGVTMTHGTWGTGVTGLKVTGLDSGEHSKTLFNELGVVNNDVITHVNNTALATWGDVLDIIDEVTGAATMEITVRRFKCVVSCSWGTRNYYYTPPLTFGELNGEAGADPSLAAAQGNANGDGVDANEGHGCGCTQQAAPGGIALFGLGLLGLGRRRRRATQELIRTGRPRRTV